MQWVINSITHDALSRPGADASEPAVVLPQMAVRTDGQMGDGRRRRVIPVNLPGRRPQRAESRKAAAPRVRELVSYLVSKRFRILVL